MTGSARSRHRLLLEAAARRAHGPPIARAPRDRPGPRGPESWIRRRRPPARRLRRRRPRPVARRPPSGVASLAEGGFTWTSDRAPFPGARTGSTCSGSIRSVRSSIAPSVPTRGTRPNRSAARSRRAPAATAWAVDQLQVFADLPGRRAVEPVLGRRGLAPLGVARWRAPRNARRLVVERRSDRCLGARRRTA